MHSSNSIFTDFRGNLIYLDGKLDGKKEEKQKENYRDLYIK